MSTLIAANNLAERVYEPDALDENQQRRFG